MPRRGENIYKRKDGRWEGRYIKCRKNGKTVYGYVYAKTYADVKARIRKSIEEERLRRFERHSTRLDRNSLFCDAAAEWFAYASPQLKPSSIVKYRNILNNYLLPYFSEFAVESITRSDVSDFANQLLVSGGKKESGLSPKSVNDILSAMKNILTYISRNVGLNVVNINGISVRNNNAQLRILSRHEQRELESYLLSDPNLYNLGILLCLYTGLRVGELCALQWSDISLKNRSIHVTKTMQRLQRSEKGETKTVVVVSAPKSSSSVRQIPLIRHIASLLKGHKCDGNAYFLSGREDRYIEPRTMQNKFKCALRMCGIEDANFHSLRHTFATRCIETGVDVKCLSEILGHASVNITLNRYVHPSMELKAKNLNRLSGLFAVI